MTENAIADVGVSGSHVVWRTYSSHWSESTFHRIMDWEVGDSSPTTISATRVVRGPVVSGERVAWVAKDASGDYHIYEWHDGASSSLEIGSASEFMGYLRIRGTRLAWIQRNTGGVQSVYTYAIGDASPTRISTTEMSYSQAVRLSSTGRIAWEAKVNDVYHIFTWKPGYDEPLRLTTGDDLHWAPNVSGDRVVWNETVNGHRQVFTWKPGYGAARQVTYSHVNKYYPEVSGARIIWLQRDSAGVMQVYTHVMGVAGTAKYTNASSSARSPALYGSRLTWRRDVDSNGEYQVFTRSPGESGETMLSSGSGYCGAPAISGDRIAFERHVGSGGDVTWALYLATLGQ